MLVVALYLLDRLQGRSSGIFSAVLRALQNAEVTHRSCLTVLDIGPHTDCILRFGSGRGMGEWDGRVGGMTSKPLHSLVCAPTDAWYGQEERNGELGEETCTDLVSDALPARVCHRERWQSLRAYSWDIH